MKKEEEVKTWSRHSRSIFERFAAELADYTHTGELPKGGDQDVRYYLELQKERLEQKGLKLEYEITPRGLLGGGHGRSWSDVRYVSKMEYQTCRLKRSFFRKGKEIYEKDQNMIFYQIITNLYNSAVAGSELYTCPNCGAVSRIDVLQSGCTFCGTFFEMRDLFPKVTNYYFIKDYGKTKAEMKRSIAKMVIPGILIGITGYFLYFYLTMPEDGYLLVVLIQAVLGGVLAGGIIGYVLWAFSMLGSLFKDAGKAIVKLANIGNSRGRFVSCMQRVSPEFSYEYFSDKVVSLLKMILFSPDAQELPNYSGRPLPDSFGNIVESSFTGAVALKKFRVQEEYCYVTVDVYMDDIYDTGRRLRTREDVFRMNLCKNISKPIDFYFSIKKIQCRGCGGSFDATKQRTCPFCGQRYELEDDDWVVMDAKIR